MATEFEERGLGAIPVERKPEDYRYRALAATVEPLPITRRFYRMRGPDFRIDQGPEGTCTAHAMANILVSEPREHKEYDEFATPESTHQWARELYYEYTHDDTYKRGAGAVDPLITCRNRGLIESYWRLESITDVIDCLLNVGPVKFASPWYASMYQTRNDIEGVDKPYLRVNPASELYGYHDWTLTGIDVAPLVGPPWVRMQNSWGPDWMDNGTVRIVIEPDLHTLFIDNVWACKEKRF